MSSSVTNKLQGILARRREAEQIKFEKTNEVNKYFDKWGRITSKYEHWTTPEYYQQVQENVEQQRRNQLKSEQLERRREKLRTFFDEEKKQHEQQLKDKKTRKFNSDTLTSIHQSFQRTAQEKQRLDLESKLYRKWRQGEDAILHEAKSTHEALAKMNWLDRQINMQLERDKDALHQEEVTLERQRESRKVLEFLQKRQQHRDDAVRDLKTMQSTHMQELKENTNECDEIAAEVSRLQRYKSNLSDELAQLHNRHQQRAERDASLCGGHNVRRIKLILKHRSDTIRQDLRDDIKMLDRITTTHDDRLRTMRDALQRQYDREALIYEQLESMYESEAKQMLQRREAVWLQEIAERRDQLEQVMSGKMASVCELIEAKKQSQRNIVGMKEAHILAIENANQRLKDLMVDQRVDEKKASAIDVVCSGATADQNDVSSSSGRTSATNSTSSKYDEMGVKLAPKFGRKKIAWT